MLHSKSRKKANDAREKTHKYHVVAERTVESIPKKKENKRLTMEETGRRKEERNHSSQGKVAGRSRYD